MQERKQQNSFWSTAKFFFEQKNSFFSVFWCYSLGVDTKKQIDDELVRIGKDRRWLAEKSGYSYFSVRDCLAPEGKKLSKRMRDRFLEEIRKEDEGEPPLPASIPPDRITVEVDPERMSKYMEAANYAHQDFKSWAIHELNRAAEAWLAEKNRAKINIVADDVKSPSQNDGDSL